MSAPGREQRVAPPAATHPTPQPLMVEAATPICDSLILMPEPAAVATGDRADDRDLQAVEDPYGPQSQEDQPVPACPRQPVQARRDARLDDPAFSQRLCRHALLLDLQRHARSRNSRTSRRTARASQLGNEGPTSSEALRSQHRRTPNLSRRHDDHDRRRRQAWQRRRRAGSIGRALRGVGDRRCCEHVGTTNGEWTADAAEAILAVPDRHRNRTPPPTNRSSHTTRPPVSARTAPSACGG
jgi:hypothetical protein